MKNITLISDWSLREPYLAMFKGRMHSVIPDVNIYDITHAIELMNINQAAFILKNSFTAFPNGTVHLILVGCSFNSDFAPVVVQSRGHFFIAPDNGVLSLLFYGEEPSTFSIRKYSGNETDYYSKIRQLCCDCLNDNWTIHSDSYILQKELIPLQAFYNHINKRITGNAVCIDVHHNIITNIPIDLFLSSTQGKKFRAFVGNFTITKYADTYLDNAEAPYFIANELGVIEITTYKGRIAVLSGWEMDRPIIIDCEIE